MASKNLSHIDPATNQPQMVDISTKPVTTREAVARALVTVPAAVMDLLDDRGEIQGPKGPIFQAAILAGTMAAKKTSDLIPLCHPLPVEGCTITIEPVDGQLVIEARLRTTHKTGLEMEALTAVSVAALTIYDMCKAVTRDITIGDIRLISKTGGKSDGPATRPA